MADGKKEALFSGVILALSCWFFYMTTTFHHPHGLEGQLQADFWPRVVLILLMAASLFLMVWNIVKKKDIHQTPRGTYEIDAGIARKGKQRLILTTLISLIYVYSLNIVGFTIATPLFLFLFLYTMGLRKRTLLVIIPPIITIFVLIFFVKLMYVMLPRGIGIFRKLSILIY